jgi:hypothetical protein
MKILTILKKYKNGTIENRNYNLVSLWKKSSGDKFTKSGKIRKTTKKI